MNLKFRVSSLMIRLLCGISKTRWNLNSVVNCPPFNNGCVIASCSYGNTTGVDSFSFSLSSDQQTASEAHSMIF